MNNLIKKILCVVATAVTVSMFMATPTYAHTCKGEFLGIPAWYNNLECIDDKDGGTSIVSPNDVNNDDPKELRRYIWTIVANIGTMIISTAAYVVVGIVAYGGLQYMLAQGDPGKVVKAKKTITNAIIGLAICAVARTVTAALSNILNRAATEANARNDIAALLQEILNPIFLWGGILGVILIVIAGFNYVSAAGDPGKVTKAKNAIINVAIGLIIILAAASIVNFALGALQ